MNLKEVLDKHKKWLNNEEGGQRANLSFTNLSFTDLSGADLSGADLRGANLRGADLRGADLSDANFSGADLIGADLRGADLSDANFIGADLSDANFNGADLRRAGLSGANLKDADLDFSCLPLWCGSLSAHFDDKQLIQIAYHLVKAGLNSKNASKETKSELSKLIGFANKFHRVKDCGVIKVSGGSEG